MNKKLVKELFIVALLAIVVIFILGILFYDYIPIEQKITSGNIEPAVPMYLRPSYAEENKGK